MMLKQPRSTAFLPPPPPSRWPPPLLPLSLPTPPTRAARQQHTARKCLRKSMLDSSGDGSSSSSSSSSSSGGSSGSSSSSGRNIAAGARRRAPRAVISTRDPLKVALARAMPSTLLADGVELPLLRRARHFVNLTNGLEALPLLRALGLPSSFVRIRSTDVEQQAYGALVAGLDANLLMALALGHDCIVWDCGSRSKNGAPRALWAGLEFVSWCLDVTWRLGGPDSGGGDGGGDGGLGGGQPQAHLRGHRVTEAFEAARRALPASTKRRLAYYARYCARGSGQEEGQAEGPAAAFAEGSSSDGSGGDSDSGGGGGIQGRPVRLWGAFRATAHDGDAAHYVALARAHAADFDRGGDGPGMLSSSSSGGSDGGSSGDAAAMWRAVARDGWGLFLRGLGHDEYRAAARALQELDADGYGDDGTVLF